MRNKKSLVALSIAAVAAIGFAVLGRWGEQPQAEASEKFFPELLDNINQVKKVVMTSEQGTISIVHRDGNWVLEEKNGYPAASQKVRNLVFGMAELRKVEPKTSKPELYAKLGLADVAVSGSRSVRVELKDGDAGLAVLLVGDQKGGAPGGGLNQYYVRALDDPQAWLVEGRLQTEGGRAAAWTEQAILELDQSRVRRVEVTHPDGEVVAVKRETPTDKDLSLVGLREDETIESAYGVNNIARSLAELTLDDVQPADGIDFDTDATRAVLETFDGLRISLLIKEHEEKKYGRLHAEFDPELRNAANAQDAEPDEAVKPVENFEQQAVEYNRLWAGRAYVLPAHQYSGIAVRRKDLVTQAGDGEPKNEKS